MYKIVGLSVLWCFFSFSFLLAQKKKHYYTDFKPTYKQWERNYIIDKIEYRKDSLVVFFRYYAISQYTSVELHAPAPIGAYPYCLENTENANEFYEMVDMKNIRIGDSLLLYSLKDIGKPSIYFRMPLNKMLTYEIHFVKPPKSLKKANLYEGRIAKNRTNHFHALDIPIKHSPDDDLGNEEDMKKNITEFAQKMYVPPAPPKKKPEKVKTTKNDMPFIQQKPPIAEKNKFNQEARIRM
ncbi:hypothetical protein [Raineya orbicola]|uniref:Uncharacterized protein n=1 Tax=Raineya orbicola TaxID=2016530 RepID=A0A2N3IIH2_9BACT|nr:hypothetical protein [Raineya orbicola]PKQ70125.1 hypothetical protein Rain11_0785 [Raineya orbicola]